MTGSSTRPPLWLLIVPATHPGAPYATATLGWLAETAGALFEVYVEDRREGELFSSSGSTAIGGAHHAAFNLLCVRFEVTVFKLGRVQLFESSISAAGLVVGGESDNSLDLGIQAAGLAGHPRIGGVLIGPGEPATEPDALGPYLYPDIAWGKRIGVSAAECTDAVLGQLVGRTDVTAAFLSPTDQMALKDRGLHFSSDDESASTAEQAVVTARIASRWAARCEGVGFGEPYAVLTLIPRFLREKRVALYGPTVPLPSSAISVSPYVEESSSAAQLAAELAVELDNKVIVGRQTTDGDIFAWSRSGVAVQIMEPNRPVFPVMTEIEHRWSTAKSPLDAGEPSDAELEAWAREGMVLTSLVWHSGEAAHTEAMLNVVDLAGSLGLKMGIGVHADRYALSAQQWELIAIARESGGMRGLIEPLLHSGGRGVMAEYVSPPEALAQHCESAMETIRRVAGEGNVPRGYYAFCDTDLTTLSPSSPDTYAAIRSAGLDYVISSAMPGRNRVWGDESGITVVNQSARSIAQASPFVRVTTVEELKEDVPHTRPGWVLATLDAPVIAFTPYIWRHGRRFLDLAEWISGSTSGQHVQNVLPSTVARYAGILRAGNYLQPQRNS